MNYFKKIIKSILPILIIYIFNYLSLITITLFYTIITKNNNLTIFINKYLPYLMIPYYIIIILIIKNKYKYKNKKTSFSYYYLSIYFGISLSIFLNMLLFLINKDIKTPTISLITSIISSAIIGPIFEEYIFRYYLLNKLKAFNNNNLSILISTIIFAIVHKSLLNIIFAFILGLFLNINYHKYNNINTSIILHIGANLIAIFLKEFNLLILILSIINLLIISLIFLKNKNQTSLLL